MADERKYVIDLDALERFKSNLDKTGMMSVEPTEFDLEDNEPTIELSSDDLAAVIENRPGKLVMNVGHNSDMASLSFDLALAVGENGGATLIYSGKIFDGDNNRVFGILFFAAREDGEDDCSVQVYEEGGGGGDDPSKRQIFTFNGILGPGTTDETLLAGDTYGFQWFEYSPKDKTYYYHSDTTTLTEIPNDLSVNWDGTVYNIPYASSADESRYYGEFVNDEFEFGTYPCGIVLTDNGGGEFEIMVFTDSSADNHYVEVLGQISDPSHPVLTFSNNESYYNVYNAVDEGHVVLLKIYSSLNGSTIWLPVCEQTGYDEYCFYGYRDNSAVKVSIARSDEYHWNYTESSSGGGSSVSGTNDGTNWTSLTVDEETYAIPQGGAEIEPATNAEIDALFGIQPEPIPATATFTADSLINCSISGISSGDSINIGSPLTFTVTGTENNLVGGSISNNGIEYTMQEIGGMITSQGENWFEFTIPAVNGDIVVSFEFQGDDEPEEDVPIESIRYTDGQGQTCIGFNMTEGESYNLWTNLEVLPANYTDGVEFISDDDGIIQVDGGGIATATGTSGDSTTITISSMEDPNIYTTVEISISENEPEGEEE